MIGNVEGRVENLKEDITRSLELLDKILSPREIPSPCDVAAKEELFEAGLSINTLCSSVDQLNLKHETQSSVPLSDITGSCHNIRIAMDIDKYASLPSSKKTAPTKASYGRFIE